MQLNPYLSFNGQCEAAFKFYEKCLGGKIGDMMRFTGSPMEADVPPEWKDKIMHASIKVGDVELMGADSLAQQYQKPQGCSVSIGLKDVAEAERIFQELSENGEVQMPIQKTFWAERFGMVVDQFGTPWMINCE
ncbi:MAG: VOC family protein [Microcoleaceae cyanobacterium]